MEKEKLINYGLVALALLVGLVFAFGMSLRSFGGFGPPAPANIAATALENITEQERLSAFTGHYIATITPAGEEDADAPNPAPSQSYLVEGLVRYEVDLAQIEQRDVRWAPRSNKLWVRLPQLTLTGPEIDIGKIRLLDETGVLRPVRIAVSGSRGAAQAELLRLAQAELLRQAQDEAPMQMARDAHRSAVQRLFEVPLRSVELTARVEAFFPDEEDEEITRRWNESRPIRKAGAAGH